mmetsp:Transcript_25976/g.24830  ORF Transcript_25976/g.24830 Transcript_25976/m.24830 type:complete len:170 (+) Transcript_25976:80-589(+)
MLMCKRISRNYLRNSKNLERNLFSVTGTLQEEGPIVGAYAEVQHSFSQVDVQTFSNICGDNNPIHLDPKIAEASIFKSPIVHGLLVSGLFSTLFGRVIHGSIYIQQSLHFKRPVYVDASVTARMEIIRVEENRKGKILTCATVCCLSNGDIAIEGQAKVLIPVVKIDSV